MAGNATALKKDAKIRIITEETDDALIGTKLASFSLPGS